MGCTTQAAQKASALIKDFRMNTSVSASSPAMAAPEVLTSLREGVLCVTLNRPERLNATTPAMLRLYMQTLLNAADDPEVRVIVVTGAGRGFCAGADSVQLDGLAQGAARIAKLRRHTFLTQIPKPVIAAINGPCVGLGFVIAMMCDMRIAARSARVGGTFARLGLPAENGLDWMLTRVVGYARAFEILASGRLYAGEELLRLGLVNQLVADDEVLTQTLSFAREMANHCSPRSLAMMKLQLQRSLNTDLVEADRFADRLIGMSLDAPDFKEAMQSRKDKRPAQFPPLTDRASWWVDDSAPAD